MSKGTNSKKLNIVSSLHMEAEVKFLQSQKIGSLIFHLTPLTYIISYITFS